MNLAPMRTASRRNRTNYPTASDEGDNLRVRSPLVVAAVWNEWEVAFARRR